MLVLFYSVDVKVLLLDHRLTRHKTATRYGIHGNPLNHFLPHTVYTESYMLCNAYKVMVSSL